MQYFKTLSGSELFCGIGNDELEAMLPCLMVREKDYKAGEYIFKSRDKAENIGLVCRGSVHITDEDFWGNRTIVTRVGAHELFSVSYALTQTAAGFSAVAAEDSTVILLNAPRAGKLCPKACSGHKKMISNLLNVVSQDNLKLSNKIEHISKRTTRNKLLSYLSEQAHSSKSDSFEIPFNRQQLADYLAVDRSAMSNELSKMQREGMVRFKGSRFTLTKNADI